jgi:pyruvate dehydrogenase E2 component (dihydrolipoamide acetyltransferase)
MRAAIAAAMSRSKREIPHYYLSQTVDVTAVMAWLEAHNAEVAAEQRLLLPALLVKAIALACIEREGFSGFYRDGRFTPGEGVHVGVAVALRGGGLVAPAVMDADDQSLEAVMTNLREIVTRARAGRLRASELSAPTIILTSLGDSEIESLYPVIQPPQVAIVGAGAVLERPWVVDGAVAARRLVTLTLAADHRVTDGRSGAAFLSRMAAHLLQPEKL